MKNESGVMNRLFFVCLFFVLFRIWEQDTTVWKREKGDEGECSMM